MFELSLRLLVDVIWFREVREMLKQKMKIGVYMLPNDSRARSAEGVPGMTHLIEEGQFNPLSFE